MNISLITTIMCMAYSIRCATAFLLHNARLFAAVALFALTWGLVATSYRASEPGDAISAFAAFLTVYSAAIVRRNAREANQRVSVLEWSALALLGTLITGFSLPFVSVPYASGQVIMATFFYAIGDVAIAWAIWSFAPRWLFTTVIAVFTIYLGFEIQYAYRYVVLGANHAMTEQMPIAFAICKVLMTVAYVTPIAISGLSPKHRRLKWWQLGMKFWGVPV